MLTSGLIVPQDVATVKLDPALRQLGVNVNTEMRLLKADLAHCILFALGIRVTPSPAPSSSGPRGPTPVRRRNSGIRALGRPRCRLARLHLHHQGSPGGQEVAEPVGRGGGVGGFACNNLQAGPGQASATGLDRP